MSDRVKVALITGICTLLVGILGTLGVSSVTNNQQTLTVFVGNSEVKVDSGAYQALYAEANQYKSMYDDLKAKYDALAAGIQNQALPLTETAPAYQSYGYKQYSPGGSQNPPTFSMSGTAYDNGFTWEPPYWEESVSMHKLDGKYKEISGILGHVDGSENKSTVLEIYFNGEIAKKVSLPGDMLATPFVINVTGVDQLAFKVSGAGYGALYGYADVMIR